MKTLLNLLPEEKKESIQGRLRSRFLLWQFFLLLLLEIFYLVILISIYLILDFQLKSLNTVSENSALVSQGDTARLNTYQQKFSDTNKTVDIIGKIDRSHLYFSQVFSLIDPLLPDGIIVSSLTTKEYTVSVLGKAATRDQLLKLDENLKKSTKCVTNVNIPIQNLFSQENIDFQVDFTLVPECLRKGAL